MNLDRILDLDRRQFFKAGVAAAAGFWLNGRYVYAEEFGGGHGDEIPATPVTVGVIGLGEQGRAILGALSHTPGCTVAHICDSYEGIHGRSQELAPKAAAQTEYRKILDDKAVQGVFIATPTHQHKQLVLDALQAGKHVYCEAPLAHTVEDAKAIAKAAKAAEEKDTKVLFQCGLHERTNPQHRHVLTFVRTGALGKVCTGRAQWNKRTSWRRKAASDERQKELNWRLSKDSSPGLLGEVGIHALDVYNWFLKATPLSVVGYGDITAWADGRDVADTVQCLVEYPKNVRIQYSATLANSFEGHFELLQGTESAVLMRDIRAWMFKEDDARALGWEVYAYREKVGDDTGIALVADATKILAQGKKPGENRDIDPKRTSLYSACESFLNLIRTKDTNVADWQNGLKATITALKANEAVVTGQKITFDPKWFEL